jgi:hypothetical protein
MMLDKQLVLALLLVITIVVTTVSDGGFGSSSRSLFVALAGATLLAACTIDGRAAVKAARAPLALTLVALAVLSVASATWTLATPAAALRWGLVVAGYAAVFIAAATLSRATGPWPIAAGVAALALLEAILGLRAVAFHALPDAERIGQTWRPGGTFEYSPALAILEVGALPVLSRGLSLARTAAAGVAAAAATHAGAVRGRAGSRLALALAAALLLALILRRPANARTRTAAIATTALVLIGGLLARVAIGGNVGPATPGAGSTGASEIAALAAAAAGAWLLLRQASRRWVGTWARAGACALAVIALAAVAWSTPGNREHSNRNSPAVRPVHAVTSTDLLHGRTHEWRAAIETWLDHPLLGAGAGAYYVASLPHQTLARSLYAHDLPLELAAELGILGLLLGVALYASSAQMISEALHSPALWLLGPMVAAFLISNLLDWTWHLAGLGALWAAASGALKTAPD